MAGTLRAFGQQQSKGPGPECFHQQAAVGRNVDGHHAQLLLIDDVDNQRIPGRPLLGLEDGLHRLLVESIRAQSIDGLGGKRYRAAAAQQFGSLRQGRHRCRRIDGIGIDSQPQCFFSDHLCHFPMVCRLV